MNVQRGLFRFWIVVSVLWVLGAGVSFIDNDLNKFVPPDRLEAECLAEIFPKEKPLNLLSARRLEAWEEPGIENLEMETARLKLNGPYTKFWACIGEGDPNYQSNLAVLGIISFLPPLVLLPIGLLGWWIAQILQSKSNLKSLTVRILIVSVFLMSLLAGVGAGGGAWLLVKLNDEDISIAAVEESCNKGSEVGDYKVDDPSCVEESLRAWAGGVGIALITLVFFGFVALVLFAIGAVSLRRHLKRIRIEGQGID